MGKSSDLAMLIGRILLAAMFIWAGYGKIGGYEGTVGYMASKGLPGILLPAVIALEVGGGILIVLGFFSRWIGLLTAIFCVAAAVIFHFDFGDRGQAISFMKNISIAGGMLYLWAAGPGSLAINQK